MVSDRGGISCRHSWDDSSGISPSPCLSLAERLAPKVAALRSERLSMAVLKFGGKYQSVEKVLRQLERVPTDERQT